MQIENLSIDIETFSSYDLSKVGVYKYVESPDFDILLFGVSINGGEVEVYDLKNGDTLPDYLHEALLSKDVIKWAYNALFERICISKYLGLKQGSYLDPASWRCTMIWSATLGLPFSLGQVGEVLGIDKKKLEEGKNLIKLFCVPCEPTAKNKYKTRYLKEDYPDSWDLFIKYNKRDVEAELAIKNRLSKFPVPEFVWDEYHIDQRINDRGIMIDEDLALSAIKIDEHMKDKLSNELIKLTGIDNPNSLVQLKEWFKSKGYDIDDLGKKAVSKLKEEITEPDVLEVLRLRSQLAKSSIKKYEAMINAKCADGRVRGTFQFYGANRTGRFSGRLIQLQNLPRNDIEELEDVRRLVKIGDIEMLEALYDDIPSILSQLIRTAFIAKDNKKFVVADFSAIEARVIAWLAGEAWRIESFKNGEDIYCASASQMFGVPVVKHGINGELRQKGKIAELALGYGGSVGALTAMGALDMGLKEEELKPLVDAWRDSNPHITKFWWDIDRVIKEVIQNRSSKIIYGLTFTCKSGMLFITLPSGRNLAYVKPKVMEINGREQITYEGIGENKKWMRLESYGPKFVENIVQAISRDILCNSMKTLINYDVVMHVHDELIIEASSDLDVDFICKEMAKLPKWADGLLLVADGFESKFYKKDS